MKLLAISDSVDPLLYEHFHLDRWRDIDLVVSCGDLPPGYLDLLCTSLGCPVLYVRGNHDTEYTPDSYNGFFDLNGRVWNGNGLSVVGFEGSRAYNGGRLQYTESEMRRKVSHTTRHIPKIDVVVTHAPPLGIHDGPDPCHAGFECFADLVHRHQPRYFVHGHTHMFGGASRVSVVDSTTTINAFEHYVIDL